MADQNLGRGPGVGKGGRERPPVEMRRDASSRILRRAAPGGPWRPGGALRWGPVGRYGIAAMRFEALRFPTSRLRSSQGVALGADRSLPYPLGALEEHVKLASLKASKRIAAIP